MLALALAGCGDNITPPAPQGAGAQSSVAGGMVATSANYRIVSTVTSGEVSAASATHQVRPGILGERSAK
jgi:hypothetical protein